MSQAQDANASYLVLAAILGAGLSFAWYGSDQEGKITSYKATCEDGSGFVLPSLAAYRQTEFTAADIASARASCRISATHTSEYRVDFHNQRVLWNWLPSLGIQNRYDGCVVYDSNNWTCRFADGSGGVGMVNGFSTSGPQDWADASLRRYFSQTRWQSWATWALNLIGIYPTLGILKSEQYAQQD